MTLVERVADAAARLVGAGLTPPDAALDAEVLARHVLGWDRAAWLCNRRDAAPPGFGARYATALARRARREPVASIVGRREFRGLAFEVTPDVLAPRPESEGLVEEALTLADGDADPAPLLADVGTGSGCLAVALAAELPAARVVATDVSAAALAVARRNAVRHGVERRIAWVRTSCLQGVSAAPRVIVANPPYVPDGDIAGLPPEVRDFEPRAALAGGADGLDVVRALLADAAERLPAGGHLVFEIGRGQAQAVRRAVAAQPGLALRRIRRDLQGIARTVVVRRVTRRPGFHRGREPNRLSRRVAVTEPREEPFQGAFEPCHALAQLADLARYAVEPVVQAIDAIVKLADVVPEPSEQSDYQRGREQVGDFRHCPPLYHRPAGAASQ